MKEKEMYQRRDCKMYWVLTNQLEIGGEQTN